MITDEQGREWLLQKLYDDGWRYCVSSIGGTVFVTTEFPTVNSDGVLDINSGGTVKCVNNIRKIMPKMERNEVLDIAEELGIIDWLKVKVDTPIYVREHENNIWAKRHFAFFKDGKVYAWLVGATSWSADKDNDVLSWRYVKLAEV